MGQSGMSGLRDRLDAMTSGAPSISGVSTGNSSPTGAGNKSASLLSDAIAARVIHRGDPVKPNMPKSGRSDGGSVRASMAKRLSMMKLYGKGGVSSASSSGAGGSASGAGRAGGTTRQQALYVSTSQRVVVKAFVSRHVLSGTPRGGSALSKHLHYLVRDGVGYEGQSPEVFDARDIAQLDQSEALERGHGGEVDIDQAAIRQGDNVQEVPASLMEQCATWEKDRHHFRFIISPEHGDRIKDMPAYTRAIMADVAVDLKEPALQWVGVCHYDTDQPHAHIVVRGKRSNGRDLVIPRRYISYGMRNRAEVQATAVLGEISRTQAQKDLFARTQSDRWTDIDAKLSRVAQHNGGIFPNHELDRTDTYGAVMRGRARHLEALGLATRTSEGLVLDPQVRAKLDGLAIKLGDEKFDIWHEAARARSTGAVHQGPWPKTQGDDVRGQVQTIEEEGPPAPSGNDTNERKGSVQRVELHEPDTISYDDQIIAPYLTPLDVTLQRRARTITSGEQPTYFDRPLEEALEARGDVLVKNGLAVDHGAHMSISPEGWGHLHKADLARAVRQQLGLSSDRLSQVHRCDEGVIMGHVNTTLGKFTIADRGVGLVAFKTTQGLELAVGLQLGGGLER